MKSVALAKGILEFVTGGVMSELKILELWKSFLEVHVGSSGSFSGSPASFGYVTGMGTRVVDFPGDMDGTDVFRVVNYAYAYSKGWCEISPDGWKRVQEVEQCLSDLLNSSQGAS